MLNMIKDASIVYSFDRTGFLRHSKSFSPLNAAAFAGKHYLVTGGTRGIGRAVVQQLLDFGAHVTIMARTPSDITNHQRVQFISMDMCDFNTLATIDLPVFNGVVLNAGGMPSEKEVVFDQFDSIFASQVVGHYLLVRQLMQSRKLTHQASIHWVSSGGMYLKKLDLSDLTWQKQRYNKVTSYANAKRAQVIINRLLGERFQHFVFSSSHPGWVGTDALSSALPAFTQNLKHRLRTAEQGADTILWCLEQGSKIKSGQFWFDRKPKNPTPFFWTKESEAERLSLLTMMENVWNRFAPIEALKRSA